MQQDITGSIGIENEESIIIHNTDTKEEGIDSSLTEDDLQSGKFESCLWR